MGTSNARTPNMGKGNFRFRVIKFSQWKIGIRSLVITLTGGLVVIIKISPFNRMRFSLMERELMELNKSSLSFGRTSAGIVCCFWGMFDSIREPHKIRCVTSCDNKELGKGIEGHCFLQFWKLYVHYFLQSRHHACF